MKSKPVPLALCAALLLAACGDDEEKVVTVQQTETETATEPKTTFREETTATDPNDPGPAKETVSLRAFQTPSHNIGCTIGDGNVRCDIREHDYEDPPKPADCDLDWGDAIGLDNSGGAEFSCHGDTAFDPESPVLAYDTDSKVGGFTCSSREDGVTCKNDSGRGFFLNRDRYRLF